MAFAHPSTTFHRMLHYLYPGRASYKRLLYFFLLWTCVGFVGFRVAFNSPSTKSWDVLTGGSGASSSRSQVNNRGLLQNVIPADYVLLGPSTTASSHRLQEDEVKIDNSPSLSESDILLSLSNVSNLPLIYWAKVKKNQPKVKSSQQQQPNCRPEFPSLFELDYNNVYWQRLASSNGTFYFYGAYYDDRWRGGPLPMVRILAMIDRIAPPPVACQLWFDKLSGPILSPATYIYGWYPKWGNYKDGFLQPYVMTCKVPRIKGLPRNQAPDSVSIVERKCDKITNNLRVVNNRPEKKEKFAVCVKGLDFLHEDLSVRLVEWLELLSVLGANKVFLYDLEVHPNISKVLDYYSSKGLVEMTRITLAGNQPNLPGFRHLYLKNKLTHKRQNELIPYNDCLYRNLYSYEYLALLDIDEIIMPIQHDNWIDLMDEVQRISLREKNYTRASYNVRNAYFLDDLGVGDDQIKHTGHELGIPKYLHMLQHVYRSRNYTKPGQYVKCFHNTERVVSLPYNSSSPPFPRIPIHPILIPYLCFLS